MSTKKKILDAALTLFSEKGYANVFVAEIAEAVGIKAPSLYKHYKSKQDIFNAILDEMKSNYDKQASMAWVRSLLNDGIITQSEYNKIDTNIAKRYGAGGNGTAKGDLQNLQQQ